MRHLDAVRQVRVRRSQTPVSRLQHVTRTRAQTLVAHERCEVTGAPSCVPSACSVY
jgi:hypothetical protein